MSARMHHFRGLGWACVLLGSLMAASCLAAIAGGDATASLDTLAALGLSLPDWVPRAFFDHFRLLNAVQLPPNVLMAVVGWGLLRKAPWSIPWLRGTAWLFLAGTLVGAGWAVWAVHPWQPLEDPLQQWLRSAFVWTTVVVSGATAAGIAWLLWRIKGARFP